MRKYQNSFGHTVLSADNGKTLFDGEIYTKIYVSHQEIHEREWTEVEDSAVPPIEEETL